MEATGQTTPADLACHIPLLAAPSEARLDVGKIETEVMMLFEQYRAPLLRYAVSLGVPVADGEEIVQEVFLSLFRHLYLGRSRSSLRGWIFRVAHTLTLKRYHANKRFHDLVDGDVNVAAHQADLSRNPEESISDSERRQRLLKVVESLPEIEQGCLRMRAEGLRYREIANALGISLGSVSTHLARSFAKLTLVDRR